MYRGVALRVHTMWSKSLAFLRCLLSEQWMYRGVALRAHLVGGISLAFVGTLFRLNQDNPD